jgi:amino acid transporter
MSTKEEETLLFHNPNAVSRIALWSNIVAWAVLVVSLLTSFSNGYFSLTNNWASLKEPTIELTMKLGFVSQIFMDAFTGIVFFLVLRGVSVGLNMLRDLFYGNVDDEGFEDEFEMEVEKAS